MQMASRNSAFKQCKNHSLLGVREKPPVLLVDIYLCIRKIFLNFQNENMYVLKNIGKAKIRKLILFLKIYHFFFIQIDN